MYVLTFCSVRENQHEFLCLVLFCALTLILLGSLASHVFLKDLSFLFHKSKVGRGLEEFFPTLNMLEFLTKSHFCNSTIVSDT